jgi:murein endopeptidase
MGVMPIDWQPPERALHMVYSVKARVERIFTQPAIFWRSFGK